MYINSLGNLVAGLFDGKPLTPNPYQTVLNWTPSGDAVGGDPAISLTRSGPRAPRQPVEGGGQHMALPGLRGPGPDRGPLPGRPAPGAGPGVKGSSYSFIPTLATGETAGPSRLHDRRHDLPGAERDAPPQINYPQGFVGTIDEVAAWTTALSQSQVQTAMTAPISADTDLDTGLVAYFNFDQTPTDRSWTNQAPGGSGYATGRRPAPCWPGADDDPD